tara:strand:- start:124 stop:957 length:834 start_codon:yes stop_codon:yes gene_type:complete
MTKIDLIRRRMDYYTIVKQIQSNIKNIKFNNGGKLVVCIVEFREMEEIINVVNCILRIYKPSEIGLCIMHGELNKSFVKKNFSHMENILLINILNKNIVKTLTERHIRKTKECGCMPPLYNKLLKSSYFYKNLIAWEYVLIMQTDTVIFRKIDNYYFDFDYIGAPWGYTKNERGEYKSIPGGNGGFSLRKISKMIETCKKYKYKKNIRNIPSKPNEDLFFSRQSDYNYCYNWKMHRLFSSEQFFEIDSIGLHGIYKYVTNKKKWKTVIKKMKKKLLD